MDQRRGYQLKGVTAFRSERIVLTIGRKATERRKVLQVVFGKDGSLFVTFPYFRHRIGLLSSATIKGTGRPESQIDLTMGGKIASNDVKYAHHSDGEAHFSQDGKVLTHIRRRSVALDRQEGHLFTVLINGLEAFDRAARSRDDGKISARRTVLTFQLPADANPAGTLKIVGRRYNASSLRFAKADASVGPFVVTKDPEGHVSQGAILASPADSAQHVLLVTGGVIPRIGTDPELLIFHGGFDPREVMLDTSREAGLLIFRVPGLRCRESETATRHC